MNRMTKFGFAWLAIAFASLFTAVPAMAAPDYTGNCAGVPVLVNNATITDNTGNCVIAAGTGSTPKSVTATGTISITANGPVSGVNLIAHGSITVSSPSQPINLLDVVNQNTIGNIGLVGSSITTRNIWLEGANASGNISVEATGDITGATITADSGVSAVFIWSTTGQVNYTGAIDSGGTVEFIANGSVSTQNVSTRNTSGAPILITANTGSISTTALSNHNSTISLTAGSGVTTTTVGTTLQGAIDITNNSGAVRTGALTANGPTGGDSGILVVSQGTITVTGQISANNGQVDLITVGSGSGSISTQEIDSTGNHISILTEQPSASIQTGAIVASASAVNLNTLGATSNIQTGQITDTGTCVIPAPPSPEWPTPTSCVNVSATGTVQTTGVNASATGTTGNGSSVAIAGNQLVLNPSSVTNITANAGTSSGNGGSISITEVTSTVPVSLGTGSGKLSLSALAGSSSGNGGTINLQAPNATVSNFIPSINLSARGTTGDGGRFTLVAKDLSFNPSAVSAITANAGSSSGNGGTIALTNSTGTGAITLGAGAGQVSLSALAGSAAGNGGSIYVLAPAANIVQTATTIDLSSRGQSGDGGHVTFNGAQLTFPSATPVTLKANAGANSGNGGSISLFTAAATQVNLGTGNGQISIFANAGSSGGAGGALSITAANAAIVDSHAVIDVSGKGANGDGGSISFSSSTFQFAANVASGLIANAGSISGNGGHINIGSAGVNPVVLANGIVVFQASGSGSGLGGTVAISNAKAPAPIPPATNSAIEVGQIIFVNAGASAAVSDFDGSISINGVSCQQHKTAIASWPSATWDCTSGNAVVYPAVANAAIALPEPYVRYPLVTNNTQLFTMLNLSDWNKFFGNYTQTGGNTDLGETISDTTNGFVASTIFAQDGNGTTNSYPAAETVLQLGQAVDVAYSTVSNGTQFTNAVTADYSISGLMNTTPCSTVFSFNTSLCSLYSGHSNTYIFNQYFFGGAQPANAQIFQSVFEHVESNAIPVPGFEHTLSYFTQSATVVNATVAPAIPTCHRSTTGHWPDNYYFYCGSIQGNDDAARGALLRIQSLDGHSAISPSPASQRLNNAGGRFFVFATPSDFLAYCSSSSTPHIDCTPSNEPFGKLEEGRTTNTSPINDSIIFEVTLGKLGTYLPEVTAHEAGHQLDLLYGAIYSTTGRLSTAPVGTQGNVFSFNLNTYDWPAINAISPVCTNNGTGLFGSRQRQDFGWICSSITTVTVGGTIVANDIVKILVLDAKLPGNPAQSIPKGEEVVEYQVVSGDVGNPVALASHIAQAINANGKLQAAGVTASPTSATVNILSESNGKNGTTYFSVVQGTESIVVGNTIQGGHGSLTGGLTGASNKEILETSWPYFYLDANGKDYRIEFWAEATAALTSNDRPGSWSPDYWLHLDPGFWCSTRVVFDLMAKDTFPTNGDYGPHECGAP